MGETGHTKNTTSEFLQEVNTAIRAILMGGQAYQIGNRSLTRADLAQLRALRDDLEAQLAASDNCGLLDRTYVAYFDGR